MRYPILATTLSLVLGGGLALADQGANIDSARDAKVAPPQPAQMDVFFETDSADLTFANDTELRRLAEWAKCKKSNVIRLEGHADPRGPVGYNTDLSERRAQAVTEKLVELGAPRDRIIVTVYGELGDRRDSLAQDRRVTALPTKETAIIGTR